MNRRGFLKAVAIGSAAAVIPVISRPNQDHRRASWSGMWQDAEGTIPVTEEGQFVGRVANRASQRPPFWPTDNDLSASGDAGRPIASGPGIQFYAGSTITNAG